MRLINVHTLSMEAFFLQEPPPYVVVSHRWGGEEMTYQEYMHSDNQGSMGHQKIVQCAKIAADRGQEWMWIDTVCIDKTSSAELTESINSMYYWYSRAIECYAILPDLLHGLERDAMLSSLHRSVYFTRGWTLQELLAPRHVYFYDSVYALFSTKYELADTLSDIIRIRKKYLQDPTLLASACIAEKMSWMAGRQTTKIEDTAYCMLGLFDVNMPLLYGERERAFFRLQLEIISHSDDESIFAWKSETRKVCGMLASWPSDFSSCGGLRRIALPPEIRVPWMWSSKGLQVRLLESSTLSSFQNSGKNDPLPAGQPTKLLTLGCWNDDLEKSYDDDYPSRTRISNRVVAINLERHGTVWQRTDCDRIILVNDVEFVSRMSQSPLLLQHYYIPQEPPSLKLSYSGY